MWKRLRGLAALLFFCILICSRLSDAQEAVESTIKDMYASSQKTLREARSREELMQAFSSFAPEWVGNMPAGETLTLADLTKQAEALLAIPPEKRPLPQMEFVYLRQTGWNVLAVYWSYRHSATGIVGSLYRDTWVQTSAGWRFIRQEKMFPDRPLIQDGKAVILPPAG